MESSPELRGWEDETRAALAALSEPRHLSSVARSAVLIGVSGGAVEALNDPRAPDSVVREADDGATRLLALGRIDDEPTLLSFALKSDQKAIAVAAVDRLEDYGAIETVAEKSRLGAAARRARARAGTRARDDEGHPSRSLRSGCLPARGLPERASRTAAAQRPGRSHPKIGV